MNTFFTSREISAHPEKIFAAFTNPSTFARWWGPSGFTNTFHLFEFKKGGKWLFVMHGPDGNNYPNENEFVDIVTNEKIVIRHHSSPNFTLTIEIKKSENGSLINWTQEFDNEEVAKSIAHIVEPSNEQNLDRLTNEVCGR